MKTKGMEKNKYIVYLFEDYDQIEDVAVWKFDIIAVFYNQSLAKSFVLLLKLGNKRQKYVIRTVPQDHVESIQYFVMGEGRKHESLSYF